MNAGGGIVSYRTLFPVMDLTWKPSLQGVSSSAALVLDAAVSLEVEAGRR